MTSGLKYILQNDTKTMKDKRKKTDKLDFIEINLFTTKDSTKKMKRQPTKEKKIFAYRIFDQELVFRICKEALKLNLKKQANSKYTKDSQTFSKEDLQ